VCDRIASKATLGAAKGEAGARVRSCRRVEASCNVLPGSEDLCSW
jgi:hypothetical protein